MEDHNTLTKTEAKLNITNDGKTYTTLKTAWLSKYEPIFLQYEA
jgi:hypothetical protein